MSDEPTKAKGVIVDFNTPMLDFFNKKMTVSPETTEETGEEFFTVGRACVMALQNGGGDDVEVARCKKLANRIMSEPGYATFELREKERKRILGSMQKVYKESAAVRWFVKCTLEGADPQNVTEDDDD